MLKLNSTFLLQSRNDTYSNTTLVKVKLMRRHGNENYTANSNTTLVKVKLLVLNFPKAFVDNSNTTLVKVKC